MCLNRKQYLVDIYIPYTCVASNIDAIALEKWTTQRLTGVYKQNIKHLIIKSVYNLFKAPFYYLFPGPRASLFAVYLGMSMSIHFIESSNGILKPLHDVSTAEMSKLSYKSCAPSSF